MRDVVLPRKLRPAAVDLARAFLGHEPQLDVALLKRGWHVAYCDVGNLFGSPRAVSDGCLYEHLTTRHNLIHGPCSKA